MASMTYLPTAVQTLIFAHLDHTSVLSLHGTCRMCRDWWTEKQLHTAMLNLELDQEPAHVGHCLCRESMTHVHEHTYHPRDVQKTLGICSRTCLHTRYNILRLGVILYSKCDLNYQFWFRFLAGRMRNGKATYAWSTGGATSKHAYLVPEPSA